MAWKLKKSKTTVDEMPPVDDESPDVAVSAAQFDRPGVTGTQDTDYSELNGSQRTVMLLNDSDYIPGLIPSAPPSHETSTNEADPDLFPVASDEDLDRYLRGETYIDPGTHAAEPNQSADINGGHPASAAVDLDEPVHVGARIDLDEPTYAPPIALDNFHLPGTNPFDNDEDTPVQAARIDLDPISPSHVPTAGHDSTAGIDLDEIPASATSGGLHDSPIGIDLDEVPSAQASAPHGSSGSVDLDYPSHGAVDHAVDLTSSTPDAPANGVSSIHHPIDTPDDAPNYFASALDASDEAVASFRSASTDEPPAAASVPVAAPSEPVEAHATGTTPMENWDLDAFAPYQPPGGAAAAPMVEPAPQIGSVPANETLASATSVSRLIVRLGQFSASYELTKAETTIGRPDPRTSVFPDVAVEWDDAVSRNHCRVLHKADGDYVEDTGSTNGTRLNDKPLSPYQPIMLSDGDRIGVGEKTDISYLK